MGLLNFFFFFFFYDNETSADAIVGSRRDLSVK